MSIEQRLREIQRESSSDAPGDPERFRRVALTESEMMSQGKAIRATLEAKRRASRRNRRRSCRSIHTARGDGGMRR